MAHTVHTDSMPVAQDKAQEAEGEVAAARLPEADQTRRKWVSEFQRSTRLGPWLIQSLRLPVSYDRSNLFGWLHR